MRVTKSFLRQIIKEELLRESVGLDPASFLKDDRIDLDFIENSGLWDDLAAGIEKLGMFILGHQKESLVKLMSLSLEECSLESRSMKLLLKKLSIRLRILGVV
ncbi:hypothetical protein HN588_07440 [Candidatus Bathyarchaeota archaeon]|jgi:hypothetical protein|nr:hypothetical protein [Candidatus Bathyarchaeota archaeon]